MLGLCFLVTVELYVADDQTLQWTLLYIQGAAKSTTKVFSQFFINRFEFQGEILSSYLLILCARDSCIIMCLAFSVLSYRHNSDAN